MINAVVLQYKDIPSFNVSHGLESLISDDFGQIIQFEGTSLVTQMSYCVHTDTNQAIVEIYSDIEPEWEDDESK